MASKLLGRTRCPLCDDDKAHVKIKTDKGEGATAYPYLHCRECGCQLHTKSQHQAEKLLGKTRPENVPTPAQDTHEGGEKSGGDAPAPEAKNTPPVAAPARASRFGFGRLA